MQFFLAPHNTDILRTNQDQDFYLPERCNRLGRLSWEGVRLCRHGFRDRWVRGEIGELGLKYRVIFGHSPIHC